MRTLATRVAADPDVPALAALINRAYRVEAFFAYGERTSEADVRARMARPGAAYLLLEDEGQLAGAVFVQVAGDRGFFAMLAVDPDRQQQGLGRRLIEAVEAHCRAAGCRHLEMDMLSVRKELPAFYARFGFEPYGTAPFDEPSKLSEPIHYVLMRKALCVVAVVALGLAACRNAPREDPAVEPQGDPWVEAQSRGIDFRAIGNEPGWYLEVDDQRSLHLVYAYGEQQATLPAVQPVVEGDVTTFESSADGRALRAVVTPGPCSDGMSDLTYPLTVTVTLDAMELRGCGRWLR
ncbi:MAG: GNAT family N-acetyltransferase [Vicinamibacterales bacterium]